MTTPETPTIPVPPGTTTAGTVRQIKVRRNTPALAAVCYDGTNAVQVAAWLLGQGRSCKVEFRTDGPPRLLASAGDVLKTGWVLPSMEVIGTQELGPVYEQVGDEVVIPITSPTPTAPEEPTPAP